MKHKARIIYRPQCTFHKCLFWKTLEYIPSLSDIFVFIENKVSNSDRHSSQINTNDDQSWLMFMMNLEDNLRYMHNFTSNFITSSVQFLFVGTL